MIEVYTDGASMGNPGPSGVGIYIKKQKERYEYSFFLGTMSNHEAEFYAVEKALHICMQQFPNEILSFHSDSQIVVHSIEKEFVKNPLYKPILASIVRLNKQFPYFFIKWIPNKHNIHADHLAKTAIHR